MTDVALPHVYSGKVRDLYAVGDDRLLMVATDRVSVFDVVLPDPVPDKGRVLTALSAWWFEQTSDLVANHLVSCDPTDLPATAGSVAGRAMLVRRTAPVRMECVARGFLFGSAWREYERSGTVHGVAIPPGLRLAERLPEPLFTPTTKAAVGDHDLPLDEGEARALVGDDRFERLRDLTLGLYERGAQRAAGAGLLLADTKVEFGELDGELLLIDELLTPDSARYWPAEAWDPGTAPPAYDKQLVRDAMDATGWDHRPPAPHVPPDVVVATRARYVEVYERLTGRRFEDWYAPG